MSDNVWRIWLHTPDGEESPVFFPEVPRLGDTVHWDDADLVVTHIHWLPLTKTVVVSIT